MTDIADAADLLETARDALLAELVPALPTERRYTALMIANAMGIAARERQQGARVAAAESDRLRRLLANAGVPALPDPSAAGANELPALRRAIATAIRAGAFDDPARATSVAAALLHNAADRLAIANPKALRTESPRRT